MLIRKFRVTLTNGEKWVTKATSIQQAKSAAMVHCPDLNAFGVHIDKIEEIT